jgi:uncharacterized lipoprotein YmbA
LNVKPTMKYLLLALASSVFAVAGCSSPQAPRFHSLQSIATVPTRDTSLPALPVDLLAVSVPPAVDQSQWVVRLPDESLRLLEQEQWVAPLRDELRAALFERLSQRFGAVDARNLPSPNAVRVKVDVQRFESVAGKEVWLDSVWSAQSDVVKAPPLLCRSTLREPVAGDLLAVAAAHRRAVVRLADQIGNQLLAIYNGAEARCP